MGDNIKVYFCPECESTNVRFVFGIGNLFGVLPRQRCFDCSFELHSFPILVANKESLRKKSKKTIKKTGTRKKTSTSKKVKKKSISKKRMVKKK